MKLRKSSNNSMSLIFLILSLMTFMSCDKDNSIDKEILKVQNYYVSTSGSDKNDGTSISEAWKTINYGVNTIKPADTLLILEGIYNERVQVRNSGTIDKPLVIMSNPGDDVIIDGSLIEVPVNNEDGLFEILSQSNIILRGITVKNSSYCGIVIKGPGTSNITITNCKTENTVSSGICAWGRTNNGDYSGVSKLIIESCEVINALKGTTGFQECISIAEGVENFEVCNCKVHDSGMGTRPGGPLGIDFKYGVRNGKAYNNEIYNMNNASGLYVDAWNRYTYNIELFNNIIYNCKDAGITIGSEAGGKLENIKVFNNLVYNCMADGLRLAGYGTPYGPKNNIKIYNNTFYGNGITKRGGIWINDEDATNVTVTNNISSQNKVWQICIGYANEQKITHVIKNNLVDGYKSYSWTDGSYTVKEIYGTNYLTGDPKFVDPAKFNFHIGAQSPAVDAARDIFPAFDIDNEARPKGTHPDIGADEK